MIDDFVTGLFLLVWMVVAAFGMVGFVRFRRTVTASGLTYHLIPGIDRVFASGIVDGIEVRCTMSASGLFFARISVEARAPGHDVARKSLKATPWIDHRSFQQAVRDAVAEASAMPATKTVTEDPHLRRLEQLAGRSIALDAVEALLETGDPRVRLAAANVLGSTSSKAGAVARAFVVNRSIPEELRAATILRFGESFPDREEVLDIALDSRTPEMAKAALEIGTKIGTPATVDRLSRASQDAPPELRCALAAALGAIGSPDAEKALLSMLESSERRRRSPPSRHSGSAGRRRPSSRSSRGTQREPSALPQMWH